MAQQLTNIFPKSRNGPDALLALPLSVITLFCFGFVLMQPTKIQQLHKAAAAGTARQSAALKDDTQAKLQTLSTESDSSSPTPQSGTATVGTQNVSGKSPQSAGHSQSPAAPAGGGQAVTPPLNDITQPVINLPKANVHL